MAGKRTYSEACGIARALDIVGERWTLMIVRELLLGPKRFTDIREGLPHLSADVLAQRLRELIGAELVSKRRLPAPAASQIYELTPKGEALEPVLIALGRWGGANAAPPPEGCGMSFDSHLVSLRTLFDPARAVGFDAGVQLSLGDQEFRVEVAAGRIEVERGVLTSPDATLLTDAPTLLAIIRGVRTLPEAEHTGDLRIDGKRAVAKRFVGLFPLPEPALA